MAYILPNLSPTLLQSKDKPSTITLPPSSVSTSTASPPTKLDLLPPRAVVQVNRTTGAQDNKQDQRNDFYVNLGLAVRTLREDLPLIFTKDLNYDIYRYPFSLFYSLHVSCSLNLLILSQLARKLSFLML